MTRRCSTCCSARAARCPIPRARRALEPYGIPVPIEELCASASRAAAEANRIGYPVRISLASPDLRVWDHPDLAVDMVDNAARVRDTFRQLMGLAKSRLEQALPSDPHAQRSLARRDGDRDQRGGRTARRARLAAAARARRDGDRLRRSTRHGRGRPHARGAARAASASSARCAGCRAASCCSAARAAQRKASWKRSATCCCACRRSSTTSAIRSSRVELRPLALLLDGNVEVREACVSVSDAFERSLSAPPPLASRSALA